MQVFCILQVAFKPRYISFEDAVDNDQAAEAMLLEIPKYLK